MSQFLRFDCHSLSLKSFQAHRSTGVMASARFVIVCQAYLARIAAYLFRNTLWDRVRSNQWYQETLSCTPLSSCRTRTRLSFHLSSFHPLSRSTACIDNSLVEPGCGALVTPLNPSPRRCLLQLKTFLPARSLRSCTLSNLQGLRWTMCPCTVARCLAAVGPRLPRINRQTFPLRLDPRQRGKQEW